MEGHKTKGMYSTRNIYRAIDYLWWEIDNKVNRQINLHEICDINTKIGKETRTFDNKSRKK